MPTRVKVEIKKLDGTLLYTFDSFNENNDINIFSVDVTVGINQTGTFSIGIEDSAKALDTTVFGLGNRVTIYAAKQQSGYQPIITGFCRSLTPTRRNTGLLEYVMEGFGAAIIFNERIVKFRRVANRDDFITVNPSVLDSRHEAWRLVQSLVNDTDVFPILSLESIKTQGKLTDIGIDKRVKEFIPAIEEIGIEASHAMDTLASSTGSVWGVDPFGDIFFKHAFLEHSGVTIKDTVSETDRADRTSYFINEWRFTDSMRKEDGFANRIYARTSAELIKDIIETNGVGFTSLHNKAIAQMIVPTAPKFKNIGFILSKVGEPSSSFNLIHGRILLDKNGLPRGNKIADFQFALKDVLEQPTNIYKINVDFSGLNVEVGKKYWVVIYERGQDEENTIRWHHNNDLTTDTNVINKNSAISDPNGKRTNTDLRWNVSNQGPVYTVATFDSVSHLVYGEDPLSVYKYGPVEMWLDVQGLDDVRSIDRYIHALLQYKAKPLRQYQINTVTIPNKLFIPGQLVTIVDQQTGLTAAKNVMAEIQEVRYSWNASQDGFGIRTCEIRPLGFYDFLSEFDGCGGIEVFPELPIPPQEPPEVPPPPPPVGEEPDVTPLEKVTGLSVTVVSDIQLNLQWDQLPVHDGITSDFAHFNIYRGLTPGFLVQLGITIPVAQSTTNTYPDVGLASGTKYYYKISAVDLSGNLGELSDEASATTTTPLPPPPPVSPIISYTYESKFGTQGTGNGQFQDPHDVSFDSTGNVFVADRVRNDIQKFTHVGVYISKFGGPGSGNGQFNVPYSIAHSPSGDIYVADRDNNRIQRLSSTGTYISKITIANGKNLAGPEDIAFDFVNGDFYVTDTDNDRIVKFDQNHNFIREWGSTGSGNGQFQHPHSIDVGNGADRNVYISCGNQPYIQKFTTDGVFIKKWGTEGNGEGQTRMFLEHMDVDVFGRVHLINNDIRPIINVWDTEGNWICQYGKTTKGSANGQFSEPEHVTVDSNGKPFVVDSGNHRIQIFSLNITTPPPPPPPTTTGLDTFGIKMLNPTRSGGRVYNSNWHLSSTTSHSWTSSEQTPNVNPDPQDSLVDLVAPKGCIATVDQTTDTLKAHGGGLGENDRNSWRYYIKSPTLAFKWKSSVEMTIYYRALSDTADGSIRVHCRLMGPTEHWQAISTCAGAGHEYAFEIKKNKDIQLRKEVVHPAYADNMYSSTKDAPYNKWIGMKLVIQKQGGNMLVRGYRDLTDGANGGDWIKMVEKLDSGNWQMSDSSAVTVYNDTPTGSGTCLKPSSKTAILTMDAHACGIRVDNTNVLFKKFSIREINEV